MSTESECYRLTPTKGEYYYAILATRSYWDPKKDTSWGGKGCHRYFAPETDKRYMGQYLGCGQAGSGDGREYWEIYLKDGVQYELRYEYKGMTCLQKTEPLVPEALIVEMTRSAVPIDANIRFYKQLKP